MSKNVKHRNSRSPTTNKLLHNLFKRLKKVNLSKLIKKALPYIIFGYFGNKMTYSFTSLCVW